MTDLAPTPILGLSKDLPFLAKINKRFKLNKGNEHKDTWHIEIDLDGGDIPYTCGDSIGVYAENESKAVQAVIKALGFTEDEPVILPKKEESMSLNEALTKHCSLAQPTKKVLKWVQENITDSFEKEHLEGLLKGDPTVLKSYLAVREIIDILEAFPSLKTTAQDFVSQLRKLVPRLYSIASSPRLHPNSVHLTVDVIEYETNNRPRIGVASTYLAKRASSKDTLLPVFLAKSHFKLPEDPKAKIIMVGPGTGIAPFRAFMQERSTQQEAGESWLFFGSQHEATDYLYKEEWEKQLQEGTLTKISLAFSRDQEGKIYVQNRMLENAAELWKWLEAGAYFYVCGDAKRMAKDVDAALQSIIETQGKLSEEDAKAYLKNLKKMSRYQRDVY